MGLLSSRGVVIVIVRKIGIVDRSVLLFYSVEFVVSYVAGYYCWDARMERKT